MHNSTVSLDDKFTIKKGRIFINGIQALVRLPMLQKALDQRNGLHTSGFISGYRGSPIGAFDAALWSHRDLLVENDIVFQPGVNEELASTAVWGTQQLDAVPGANVDGVFSIWYGKGPGVDRAGDALKHGNFSGSHKNGGVLVIYGDDHPGKSSTIAHQSEPALAANFIPSLYPSTVQEFLEYGLLGWQMSRYTGLWVGFKTINETIEQTATIDIDLESFQIKIPKSGIFPEQGINHRPREYNPILDEMLIHRYKIPLVHEFVKANNIDRVHFKSNHTYLGIVTAGKTFQDTLHALKLLGIDEEKAKEIGISIYKIGCIWPIEPSGIKAFSKHQKELLVIEEKRAFMEEQIAKILINESNHPPIFGKKDQLDNPLLDTDLQLTSINIALVIAQRLEQLGIEYVSISTAVVQLNKQKLLAANIVPPPIPRTPFFCSGCPHNRSTKQPLGSIAMAGIGCHAIASAARPYTLPPTQMGGEGLNWTGMARFSNTNHVFQNLGDGTYYHSGILSIRAAVASKTNITFKILFNDAVAMTGGQPIDGPISVAQISQQVISEGVKRCVVVTDYPETYRTKEGLAKGVDVYHRDQLDFIQKQLSAITGCTVLIYEQTCAAEKRRRRKRGSYPDPLKRYFINDDICEGCGDCSVQSNCVSLLPYETAMGKKRQIDQSSCNKDYSCVTGFCPSFVTVIGGQLRVPPLASIEQELFDAIPSPNIIELDDNFCIMVAGIGGSGVITVSSLLGMAAHIENHACSIYDMTGLSQKNGAVFSHLRIAKSTSNITTSRIGCSEANLVLGFDLLAALANESQLTFCPSKTIFVGNSQVNPTAAFQFMPDIELGTQQLEKKLIDQLGADNVLMINATKIAKTLCGNTIAANLFMMGYVSQLGLLPVKPQSIVEAITLNNVAVEFNINAFKLGRLWEHSKEILEAIIEGTKTEKLETIPTSLNDIIEHRVKLLSEYQNSNYASKYKNIVLKVIACDNKLGSSTALSIAVATNLAKLMAYKDEYEVARLFNSKEFMEKLKVQFEGNYSLRFNLSPPLLAKKDKHTGLMIKEEFGSWAQTALRFLALFKGLRGTKLDIFGYTKERKIERQLITEYIQLVEELISSLSLENYQDAVQLFSIPKKIRGFGHVKAQQIEQAQLEQQKLLDNFRRQKVSD